MPAKPTHIFFDIGGVLYDYNVSWEWDTFKHLLLSKNPSIQEVEIQEMFSLPQRSELVLEAHRNESAEDDYLNFLNQESEKYWGVSFSLDDYQKSFWAVYPRGRQEKNINLLKSLSEEYRVGLLSDQVRTAQNRLDSVLGDVFATVDPELSFISHYSGRRKGDGAIWFEEIIDSIGVPAHDCLFIDDVPSNLESAKSVGWHTFLCSPFCSDLEGPLSVFLNTKVSDQLDIS